MGTGLNTIDSIVFDLGGVMIDWNPMYVYADYFEDPAQLAYFFDQVCTSAWNEEQDAGKSLALAMEERIAIFPEWEQSIKDYYGRWTEMLAEQMEGTVALFRKLKNKNKWKIYALTNWSAETFPYALQKFDFLHEFDGILVSGEEKLAKPDPAIFHLLIDRYKLIPPSTIYIDDNLRNVKAAADVGFQAIHFTSPEELSMSINNLLYD